MYKKLMAIALSGLYAVNTVCFVPNLLLRLANIGSAAYVYEKGVRPFVTGETDAFLSFSEDYTWRELTNDEKSLLCGDVQVPDSVKIYMSNPRVENGRIVSFSDHASTNSRDKIWISEYVSTNGKFYKRLASSHAPESSGVDYGFLKIKYWTGPALKNDEYIQRTRATLMHELGHIKDNCAAKEAVLVPTMAATSVGVAAIAERMLYGPLYIAKQSGLIKSVRHFGKSLARCALRIPGAHALYGLSVLGMYRMSRYYENRADDNIDVRYIPASIAEYKEIIKKHSFEKRAAEYTKNIFPMVQELVQKYKPEYEEKLNGFCYRWLNTHPTYEKRVARFKKRLNAQALLPEISYNDRMTMLERGETKDGLSFNVYLELLEAKQQEITAASKKNKSRIKNIVSVV